MNQTQVSFKLWSLYFNYKSTTSMKFTKMGSLRGGARLLSRPSKVVMFPIRERPRKMKDNHMQNSTGGINLQLHLSSPRLQVLSTHLIASYL